MTIKAALRQTSLGVLALASACYGSAASPDGGVDYWYDGAPTVGCGLCFVKLVQVGSFTMGCETDNEPDCDLHPDAEPAHVVAISAPYWILESEVSKYLYDRCVSAGACTVSGGPPIPVSSGPVCDVTWQQAQAFCAWVGGETPGRLPTEAEWEYAARGTDGYRYPWGDTTPTCDNANYAGCPPDGKAAADDGSNFSPFGVRQMAGNVAEWVSDYYDPSYYAISPSLDPTGPAMGTQRVVRGGSYADDPSDLRTWVRQPGTAGPTVGFRCVFPVSDP